MVPEPIFGVSISGTCVCEPYTQEGYMVFALFLYLYLETQAPGSRQSMLR